MPPIVQAPTEIIVTMTVERNGARFVDLELFLKREITRSMEKAQYTTPAAPKMTSLKVVVREKPVELDASGTDLHPDSPWAAATFMGLDQDDPDVADLARSWGSVVAAG